jgi:hypothetical protein
VADKPIILFMQRHGHGTVLTLHDLSAGAARKTGIEPTSIQEENRLFALFQS